MSFITHVVDACNISSSPAVMILDCPLASGPGRLLESYGHKKFAVCNPVINDLLECFYSPPPVNGLVIASSEAFFTWCFLGSRSIDVNGLADIIALVPSTILFS